MEGHEKPLTQILAINSSFIIPLYQRNYDWKEEHCEQLFSDLIKLRDPQRHNHFFGSIVSKQQSLTSPNIYIIDGQQRITTISLLLIALYKLAQKGELKYENEVSIKKIYGRYLVDEYSSDRKIKLKPIKNDMNAFDALLFKDEKDYDKESNVTRNYKMFVDWIKKHDLILEDYLTAIEKLVIIDIKLNENDDAQLIFESLNSTGKDLEEADKIRNYLLMSLQADIQEKYYNEYWNKIETYTDYKPTMFIRNYLTIKLRRICKIDNLYKEFKKFAEFSQLDRGGILSEMLEYAEYYDIFKKEKTNDVYLKYKFQELNTVGTSTAMPYYLGFMKYSKDNNFSVDTEIKVFDIIENYLARRIICNLPTNALNKVFSTLQYDIVKFIDKNSKSSSDYLDVLKFVLLKKLGNSMFPNDIKIRDNFQTRQIYRIPLEYKYFLFERMENGNEKGYHNDVVNGMKDNAISIEHIMPQTLTKEWKNALGNEWERIHERYLHTFANLTLTGYNSNYGNRTFAEKRDGFLDAKGEEVIGLNKSAFKLTESVKNREKWTEEEMIDRCNILTERFLKLFPMISTDITEKPADTISFEGDDVDEICTNRNISAFHYMGVEIETTSWKEMLILLCKIVYTEHKDSVIQLCYKNEFFFSNTAKTYFTTFEENCFVRTSSSTKDKMQCIRYLFDHIGIDYAELEFELVPLSEIEEMNTLF